MSLCCNCKVIVFENFFACTGECSKIIHYGCVGIKKPVFDIISAIPNFSWHCYDCINYNNILKSQNEIFIDKIQKIADSLITLNDTSTFIKNKIDKMPVFLNSPVVNKTNENKNENSSRITRSKQIEKDISTIPASTSTNIQESSDLKIDDNNTNNFVNNNNTSNVIIGTNIESNNSLRVVEPSKWIFISRLHKDIVNDDLKNYILEKFKIDKVKIVRIKPRVEDVDYVSFKIGVPVNNFDLLLQPVSWPAGVLIKEFVNYQRKSSERFLIQRSALVNQS